MVLKRYVFGRESYYYVPYSMEERFERVWEARVALHRALRQRDFFGHRNREKYNRKVRAAAAKFHWAKKFYRYFLPF